MTPERLHEFIAKYLHPFHTGVISLPASELRDLAYTLSHVLQGHELKEARDAVGHYMQESKEQQASIATLEAQLRQVTEAAQAVAGTLGLMADRLRATLTAPPLAALVARGKAEHAAAEMLPVILSMAKGYACANQVGANMQKIREAEKVVAALERKP